MSKKRVYKKKFEDEIKRLTNMLLYSKCSIEDKIYIQKNIEYLKNEIGLIK